MNERDDELREQAWTLISNEERTQGELYETRERWKKCDQMFADLIRADERERIKAANAPEIERINAYIKSLEDAVKAERKACLKLCKEHFYSYQVYEAIHARGNT